MRKGFIDMTTLMWLILVAIVGYFLITYAIDKLGTI